ncbi:MAG TPA: TetR/AcrR family transcriptional regulator [Candidatus Saccharimonadia bacterium]
MPVQRLRSVVNSSSLRRSPKQLRGQRRVEQILHHAEMAFSELGFDQTTTNLIAERAGVSIGSLYQFFSSKEAILEAMAERYLRQTQDALHARMAVIDSKDLEATIHDLLELVVKLQERRPYFLQCLTGQRPSPSLNHAVNELSVIMAQEFAGLLRRFGVETEEPLLQLRSRICVETVGILLPFVVRARGRQRRMAMTEIEQLMAQYIRPMLPTGRALV